MPSLGCHQSEEAKKKISKFHLGKKTNRVPKTAFKTGDTPWNKGKKGIQKAWNKGLKGFLSGNNSPRWKGGISKIDKLCRQLQEYKQWRSDCFERDNWTCMNCKKNNIYLTVHHKKGFSKIIKENNIKNISDSRGCKELWDLNNGITLCEECHKLTDNYKGKSNKK